MEKKAFTEALKKVKIPVLVLDQKWHRLFALQGKPDKVKELEEQLSDTLARQGRLTQELKDLKRLKSNLMKNIVDNMDAIEAPSEDAKSKKMEEDRRLIDEINQKISDNEDALLDIPREITTYNDALMMETMTFCYEQLRVNYREAEEISDWIKQIRVELKKNIIRKQNREINNREIYAYMHDVFGKDIINLFDVKNNDVDLDTGEDRPEGDTSDSKKLSKE
ncbi:MAG: hypothetical protein PUB19_02435 [Lachnospiraceae bacterium]|nr:hypothetical protein [Lachnospiraceae bacterium]